MSDAKKHIVLIPAYMPDNTLIELANTLHDKGFHLVVVNDGSSEDRRTVFEKVKKIADVVEHEKNKGKGAALKTGLKYIRDNFGRSCIVVTADADGQHRPDDIAAVCSKADELENTLVLGARTVGYEAPFRSRMGNKLTRWIFKVNTHREVHDTQTGLRAFGSEHFDTMLSIEGDRYEYEMKVLLYYARKNLPIAEVPITSVYFDGNSSSHFNTVRDSFRIYREIFRSHKIKRPRTSE